MHAPSGTELATSILPAKVSNDRLSVSEKRLRFHKRKFKRACRAKRRRRAYLLQKHRDAFGLSLQERAELLHEKSASSLYTRVRAPEVFSFLRNPEGVAEFIAELRVCFDSRTPVWVVLKRVTETDYDCITVLLSVMVRFKSQNIKFDGDFPKDKDVRRSLVESRFFEHLYKGKFRDSEKYELTEKSSIVTHAMKSVDPELGASLIRAASRTIWGQNRRCPGVQRTFIELMQNTNNHASMTQEGEKHWWLSIRHEEAERKVRFSFVDYGVGVFFNLQNKRNDNKFFRILDRLNERFRYGNNAEVLKLIFSGELHRTASGKSFRGKGLPGVYEAFSDGKISNLALITNNVFFNSVTNEYRILDIEFQGTFISWELGLHNHSLPDED